MELEVLIKNSPLLAPLPPADCHVVAENFIRRTFRKGESIFRQGEPGGHLYLIESGRVKISSLSPDGREVLVAIIGPGEIFGELSLFDVGLRTADARTMEETTLHALAHDIFRHYVEAHPKVAWEMLRILASRLRRADEVLQDAAFFDVPGRVAKRLLSLASQHGSKEATGGLRIDVPLTQEEIAQMVGASRESVNKALASFLDRGWVTMEDRNYTIRDPDALAARLH
ncbi:MAG: Crp/Fnr family transcriptional regulator [Actinomycetota bacterium]|nr:Crp/Fnr family transcriptional regulator [Actinomycetota bacterium]